MVLFNNISYKRMRLTNKVNLTKRFSEKYKRIRLITRLYGTGIKRFIVISQTNVSGVSWFMHAVCYIHAWGYSIHLTIYSYLAIAS